MSNQYRIPIYLCQWCFKKSGSLILDCYCLVCRQCYQTKKQWFSEPEKCFCCEKKTLRRFIDVKAQPQQYRKYFRPFNDMARIYQFQQEAMKKYCKHLQKRIKSFQQTIHTFLQQFPQYGQFFQKSQNLQNREKRSIRSKSSQTFVQNHQINPHVLYPSHTQKCIVKEPPHQIKNNHKSKPYLQNNPQKRINVNRIDDQYIKKSIQKSIASKKSSHLNDRQQMMKERQANSRIMTINRSRDQKQGNYESQFFEGPNLVHVQNNQKRSMQLPFNQNQNIPVYRLKQNKKLSDRNEHQNNLSNINMQTALRSIRSQNQKTPQQQEYTYRQDYTYQQTPLQKQFNFRPKRFPK